MKANNLSSNSTVKSDQKSISDDDYLEGGMHEFHLKLEKMREEFMKEMGDVKERLNAIESALLLGSGEDAHN